MSSSCCCRSRNFVLGVNKSSDAAGLIQLWKLRALQFHETFVPLPGSLSVTMCSNTSPANEMHIISTLNYRPERSPSRRFGSLSSCCGPLIVLTLQFDVKRQNAHTTSVHDVQQDDSLVLLYSVGLETSDSTATCSGLSTLKL